MLPIFVKFDIYLMLVDPSNLETFEKYSILFEYKEDKNFNHRNILNISRIEI